MHQRARIANRAVHSRSAHVNGILVFVAQVANAATPLVLAALGGVLSERSGVATLSLEGYLLVGAFGAAVAALATGSALAAVLAAMLAGALLAALFAWSTVILRAHAIIAGVAVNLFAAAVTRVALKVLYDSASNSPPLLERPSTGGSVAWVAMRDAFSSAPVLLAPLVLLGAHILVRDTVFGLRLSAAGEHPEALRAQGVSVCATRFAALVAGGAVAALGGAQLTLHQHEFVTFMSGGRGFLALAAVILGRWTPLGAAKWALAIGALSALESTLGASVGAGSGVSTALLQATPFLLTLLAVVGLVGRARPPAALE